MRFMEFKATSIARSGQLYENDLGIDFQSDSQKDSINTIVKKVLFYMQPGYIIDSHSILPYIPNDCKLKMLIALHNLQYNYIIQLAALCDNKFV